jgi:hypothetical protein
LTSPQWNGARNPESRSLPAGVRAEATFEPELSLVAAEVFRAAKAIRLVLPWLEFRALSLLPPDLALVMTSTTPKMVMEDMPGLAWTKRRNDNPTARVRRFMIFH